MGMKEEWEKRQALAAMYPHKAGWKDSGASKDNADRINAKGSPVVEALIKLYSEGFHGTADDAAEALQLSSFTVRPACTRLLKLGILMRTPERRIGTGGGTASVLKLKTGF